MRDGTIVAQDVDVLFDGGAYAAGKPIPTLLPGLNPKLPYRFPAFRLTRTCVYTNTIPGCFIRSPGDVQIMFALESAMDMVARDTGLDPIDLRRRNAVVDGDRDIQGHVILEPRAAEVLDRLEAETAWRTPLPPGRGRGMAFTLRHIGNGTAHAQLVVRRNGDVLVRTGTTEQGMGILTVLQRVVATELGLPFERVRAERGATDVAGADPGVGSSRTTHISGGAALDACRRLRERLAEAAEGARLDWDRNVAALLAGADDELVVTGTYEAPDDPSIPEYNDFVAYAVEVTVDRDTCAFTIDDVVLVTDVGTILNPVAHRGQIDGGFVYGLGAAVTEELRVEDGRITNLSFADYKLPTMRDIPPFRVALIHTGTGPGPFGARAVGELNLSGVGPAIANAVADAVGARITTLPITAERIHAALAASGTAPAD
jgi:CO/xanthine dehydrogenase Mo-binding subunit